MMARSLNGSGSGNGSGDDDKIASLDEARKRLSERERQKKRAARDAKRGGPLTVRDWIIGGVVVLMALGLVGHWIAPLMGAKGLVR